VKYIIAIIITAVVVFLGATFYYKGLPTFSSNNNVPVATQSMEVSQTPIPIVVTATATPSDVQTADQNISIVSAVQAALVAEHGQDAASLNVTVSKVEGLYAQGGASGQGGGGMWFAAKVNGIWKLVWDGNGQINCSDLTAYPAFPKDMISECWDTATNKIVTR
jgi:hypothetical protein